MSVHYANIDPKLLREINRRRRGSAEYKRMLARYEKECGECLTFSNEEEYEEFCKNRKQNT